MAGPKGNSEFCFSETSMFPEAKPTGTLRLEGKQNSLFAEGPVIECFVIPPNANKNNTRMLAYDFIEKCYKMSRHLG